MKKQGWGDRIKAAREAKPLTQKELGHACGWKSAESRISQYESESREPTLSDLMKMAKAIGVHPATLAFETVVADPRLDLIVRTWERATNGDRDIILTVVKAVAQRPPR